MWSRSSVDRRYQAECEYKDPSVVRRLPGIVLGRVSLPGSIDVGYVWDTLGVYVGSHEPTRSWVPVPVSEGDRSGYTGRTLTAALVRPIPTVPGVR